MVLARTEVRRSRAYVAACLLLGSCTDLGSFNFRYTVTMDTPQGPRAGSSVITVRGYTIPGSQHIGGGQKLALTGDVPFVDLPNGVTIFALLADPSGGGGPLSTMLWSRRRPGVSGDYKGPIADLIVHPVCKTVERERLPIFLYFTDPRKPDSSQRIKTDEIAGRFGADYRVRKVSVCVTHDEPKWTLEKRLLWLSEPKSVVTSRFSISALRYNDR